MQRALELPTLREEFGIEEVHDHSQIERRGAEEGDELAVTVPCHQREHREKIGSS